MVIDTNAYVITHPQFLEDQDIINNPQVLEDPDSINNRHLSALEPFLMRDMYHMAYFNRVYCNNFQYNDKFTKRPRKQYSYEVTEKVWHSIFNFNVPDSSVFLLFHWFSPQVQIV